MTLALSEMSEDVLRSEIRIANHKKDHFRVAAIKRELVRRRELRKREERNTSIVPPQRPWWMED